MLHTFIGRIKELQFLEEAYSKPNAQLIIIYGRRRVGKTELIKKFIESKPHTYFLCTQSSEMDQIRELYLSLASALGVKGFLPMIDNWRDLFLFIHEQVKNKRFVLAIDEFPFLAKSNTAISSIFQKYWDEYLSRTGLYLILCGSSISMMESHTLAYKAPLYGRRTGQWKVEPLRFKEVYKLFKKDLSRAIEFFSIAGGVPFYLSELNLDKSASENIKANIARKGTILYQEGEFLLKEELSDPATYFSILSAIAGGKTKQGEIAQQVGIEKTTLPRYLTTLQRLGFIERISPVTEKARSKKSLYIIFDEFLRFWFKFIFKNESYIEEGNSQKIVLAMREFNAYVGRVFESICRQAILEEGMFKQSEIGKWWGNYREASGKKKTAEIDIVAINEGKDILFVECKWKNNVNAEAVLAKLKQKAALVNWNNNERKESFIIYAKSFSKKIIEARCLDLNDLSKIFQ